MRLVSCLKIDLEPDPERPGSSRFLVAWLDSAGNARYTRPLDKWKRLVDVLPGDWVRNHGRRFQVKAVEPYRSHEVPADYVASERAIDGFVMD